MCRDITDGTYFPAASLFTDPSQAEGATVTFNFGEALARPMWHPEAPTILALAHLVMPSNHGITKEAVAAGAGPTFRFPPPDVEGCPPAQPVSELAGDPPTKGECKL